MRLRVAAVVEQAWHRVPGGTAESTIQTIRALERRDDVEMVGVAAFHRDRTAIAPPASNVVHLPMPRRALYDAWHSFRRPAIQRWAGSLDVVHGTGGVIPPAGDASLVVTIHDLAFVHFPEHLTARGVRFQARALELVIDEAAAVICPSQATADDCIAQGVASERVHVIPWGVNAPAVGDANRAAVAAEYDLPDRFVLSVGTLEPRKNLARLIEAVSALDEKIPLVIVGPSGWGGVEDEVRELAATSDTAIRWLGFVPSDHLYALYDACTVFAYPSLFEGFGMPVLEAMAQGAAVVTSTGTATEEVVGDAGEVVDPTDTEAIANALRKLLEDEERRSRLGESAKLRASTFDWETTAAQTRAVYELVSGQPR